MGIGGGVPEKAALERDQLEMVPLQPPPICHLRLSLF